MRSDALQDVPEPRGEGRGVFGEADVAAGEHGRDDAELLIGEAERFPDLARAWYQAGPEKSCAVFATWFQALDERGLLQVPDPLLAAQHFNWLILSIPVNRAMSLPLDGPVFTRPELNHYADEGVRVFLAAYGPAAHA